MSSLRIGQLAKASGLGVETIRFYEREGLLAAPPRTATGYRQYSPQAVDRLRFVRRAKDLGFTLAEIRQLLGLQTGEGRKSEVKALTQSKLDKIDRKIEGLQRMRSALSELEAQCSGRGSIKGCPIIEALTEDKEDD